ncbi:MAG: hypothetical protein K9K67_13715 [Bacteriovoracaceae bacterium]|nr:hypothetical protein [Bacteriovoracaceae bacterium]
MHKIKSVLIFGLMFSTSIFSQEPFPMDQNAAKWESESTIRKGRDNYLVGTFEPQNFSYKKITHILVPGSAMGDESDQFFQTTLLRAKMYRKLYPTHQVVIISQPDVIKASQEEVFARFNLPILENVGSKLTAGQLLSQMLKFEKIASFDFYGHSSPWALRLGKKDASMYASDGFAKLKSKFIPGAYATLNGCNGGFILAPDLSKLWGIPVSGALTGSLFERLQADGKWYKKPDRTQSEWSLENAVNFESAASCSEGVCWRMKPQRNNYGSYWGNFKEGGLSFYKFFCNYPNADKSCFKGMANSILSFQAVTAPTQKPSWATYEAKVFDYLCSTAKDSNYFDSCVEGIKSAVARGDNVFKAHPGNALNCDFKKCDAEVVCKQKRLFGRSGPKPGTCHLDTKVNQNPTTIVREYLAFKKGFEQL